MSSVVLMPHQQEGLDKTARYNRVAYYWDMGLGKTFMGSEKMEKLGEKQNVLICQKSLIKQWVSHFRKYYSDYTLYDLTDTKIYKKINQISFDTKNIFIINYDLIFRRNLPAIKNYTLILDESSMIQNEKAKRAKAILALNPKNIILLSGTPTGGKYENLWSQCKLLGWDIKKTAFLNRYVVFRNMSIRGVPYPIKVVSGYKNIEELKEKMREHGASFMKAEDVLDLPEQSFYTINIDTPPEYKKFMKTGTAEIGDEILIADTPLTRLLVARELCSIYSEEKLVRFKSLLESTDDRLIVFYNFKKELEQLLAVTKKESRPISIINGSIRDLTAYENESNSVTFIQYQAGAMGLNLQKANKIVYYSLTCSSELFEQSKKRTHRIGQNRKCIYYYMICEDTVEEHILETLSLKKDYTDNLFKMHNIS